MDFTPHPDFAERPAEGREFKAILLVDDDRELVQTLQWVLADQCFLVDKAYDGQEAMLKIKANEYDAVICDMLMPHLRGDEVYIEACSLRPGLAGRFIFITGFAADRQVHRFINQHGVKYFVKPVRIQTLINCVRELVSVSPPRPCVMPASEGTAADSSLQNPRCRRF